jgi:HEAT repeat protein
VGRARRKRAMLEPMLMRRNRSKLSFLAAVAPLCLFGAGGALGQPSSALAQLLTDFDQELIDFAPQFEIAKRIVALNERDALQRLEQWLEHEDRHFRANVAFIFASLGEPRGFEVLYGIVNDRSDRPLGQGIAPMRILGNTEPAGWWIREQVLADRYYAVHLLGVLRDPQAVDVLLPLAADEELGTKVRWALVEIPHVWEARLRVANTGGEDIEDLTVLSPKGSIEFGDGPARSTSAYREAPDGVYGCPVFQLKIDGQLVTQPRVVIDWFVELPMPGRSFTCKLELVRSSYSSADPMVRLVEVTVDE